MTPEELDAEFQRSSRHLNNEFERSLRSLQRQVGREGQTPLTKAAVDTLEQASPRTGGGGGGGGGSGSGRRKSPALAADADEAARNELEDTLRLISEKRQRRIRQLQELNHSAAADFLGR